MTASPLTPENQQDRDRRAHALARDLGSLADHLVGVDHRCALAAFQDDYGALADNAEQLLQLHVRFAELCRTLLAAGRPTTPARRGDFAAVHGERERDGD